MDFRKATDGLFDCPAHADLAKALGVSVAAIRQARLKSDAKAHRSPPENWQHAVIELAEKQVFRYRQLIQRIRNETAEQS